MPVTTSMGTSDCISNDVCMVIRDEGSRVVIPADGYFNLGERIKSDADALSRGTLIVEGGVFGTESESSAYILKIGRDAR